MLIYKFWPQSLNQQLPYFLKHNNVSDTCLMISYHLTWQKSKYLSLEIKIFTPSYPNLFWSLILFPTHNILPTESTQCPLKMLLRTYKGFDCTLHSTGPPGFLLYLDIQVILLVNPLQTPYRSLCFSKHLLETETVILMNVIKKSLVLLTV